MYTLVPPIDFTFLRIFNWCSDRNFHEKMKINEHFGNVNESSCFFTQITNMIILLYESFVLVEKTEKYRQNFIYFTHNLVKMIFLDKEKKRKKCDAYFCEYPKRTLNEKKVTLLRVKMCAFYFWQRRFFR